MTTEEQLTSKLESIKESITSFKFSVDKLENKSNFITDALNVRVANLEQDLAECFTKMGELSNTGILVGEQLRTLNRSMEAQSTSVRAVQSNVLGAIMIAVIVSITGTAISTFHRVGQSNQESVAERRAT